MRQLFSLLLIACSLPLSGQDTLLLFSGEQQIVHIEKQNRREVRFRPAYSSSQSSFLLGMEKVSGIRYADGRRRDFQNAVQGTAFPPPYLPALATTEVPGQPLPRLLGKDQPTARVYLQNNYRLDGHLYQLKDSTLALYTVLFRPEPDESLYRIPVRHIKRIEGAGRGNQGLGALAGMGVGFGAYALIYEIARPPEYNLGSDDALLFHFFIGLPASVIGALIGANWAKSGPYIRLSGKQRRYERQRRKLRQLTIGGL